MASAKRTSERKKGVPATRMGTSKNSKEGPPDTAQREKPTTSETPASVEGKSREGTLKAVTAQMPLTSGISASLVGSSESETMGQMSAARVSSESKRPGKGSASRERSSLGLEKRNSAILPQEDVGIPTATETKSCPEIPSFEEDDMLKRPPPDFVLGPEHWLGLHEEIREKLWQAYRLVNPTTFAEAEQSSKVAEAISKAREEHAENKAGVIFKEEHQRKRSDLQSQLEGTAR